METNSVCEYKTDPIFERYVQPYDKEAEQQLLATVLEDIDGRVLHIWKNTHLNDRTKYEICKKHGIKLQTKVFNFSGRNSAACYICTKELQRKDLTEEYRKYLIGQLFHYKELIESKDVFRRPVVKSKLAADIAKSLAIHAGTVAKYNQYSDAMDLVYERAPELAKKILLGKVKVSHENVVELSRLRTEELHVVSKAVEENRWEKLTIAEIRNEIRWNSSRNQGFTSVRRERREAKRTPTPKTGSIRQMPQYDPDAEVNSLCMTMGSWISSIKRVNTSVDFTKITIKARLRLSKELASLDLTIKDLQQSLEERTG